MTVDDGAAADAQLAETRAAVERDDRRRAGRHALPARRQSATRSTAPSACSRTSPCTTASTRSRSGAARLRARRRDAPRGPSIRHRHPVRPARPDDLPRLVEIYNHYIINTPTTFDLEPYSVDQRREWFSHYATTGRHRLLVAEDAAGHCRLRQHEPLPPARAPTTRRVEMTVHLRARGHRPRHRPEDVRGDLRRDRAARTSTRPSR